MLSPLLIEDACDGDLSLSPLGKLIRQNIKITDLQSTPTNYSYRGQEK